MFGTRWTITFLWFRKSIRISRKLLAQANSPEGQFSLYELATTIPCSVDKDANKSIMWEEVEFPVALGSLYGIR